MKKLKLDEDFEVDGRMFYFTNSDGNLKLCVSERKPKVAAIPTEQEIKQYALSAGYDPEFMWEKAKGYIDAGMVDSRGTKIKNLKLKLNQVWFKPEHKVKPKEVKVVR